MNPDSLHSSILRIHDDSWFLNAICPAMMRSMWEGFGHSLWRCYLQPWTSLKDISWGFRTLGFAFPQFWEYVWSPSEHVRNCLWKIGWKNATGAMTPATSIMCTASAPRYRPVIRPGLLRWHGTLQWSCHWDPLRIIIYIYIYIFVSVLFPINHYNTFQSCIYCVCHVHLHALVVMAIGLLKRHNCLQVHLEGRGCHYLRLFWRRSSYKIP